MTRKNRNKKKNVSVSSKSLGKASRALCSVSDPFCKHAIGANSPYGSSVNTITLSKRVVVSLTTGAGGDAFLYFRPSSSTFDLVLLTATSTAFPATQLMTNQIGLFPDFVDQVRVVSAGVRWWNLLPDSATGGNMIVVPIKDDSEIINAAAAISTNALQLRSGTEILDLREPGAFVCAPLERANEFIDKNTISGNSADSGELLNPFTSVLIQIDGPASSKTTSFELVVHYECTLNFAETANASMTSKLKAEDGLLLSYWKKAKEWAGVYTGTPGTIGNRLKNAATSYASRTAMAYASKLLPPPYRAGAAAVGLLMDDPYHNVPEVD